MAVLKYKDPETGEVVSVVGGASEEKISEQIGIHNSDGNAHSDIRQAVSNAQNAVQNQIGSHNSSASAHADIRELIANKKGAQVYTASIGTSWAEDSNTGVKTQTVAISGVTAGHTATVDHARDVDGTSEDYALYVEEENQFLTYITNGFAKTVDGGILFTIFGDAPTISIPIVVEVV